MNGQISNVKSPKTITISAPSEVQKGLSSSNGAKALPTANSVTKSASAATIPLAKPTQQPKSTSHKGTTASAPLTKPTSATSSNNVPSTTTTPKVSPTLKVPAGASKASQKKTGPSSKPTAKIGNQKDQQAPGVSSNGKGVAPKPAVKPGITTNSQASSPAVKAPTTSHPAKTALPK